MESCYNVSRVKRENPPFAALRMQARSLQTLGSLQVSSALWKCLLSFLTLNQAGLYNKSNLGLSVSVPHNTPLPNFTTLNSKEFLKCQAFKLKL